MNPLVIAEIGNNHFGDFDTFMELVKQAKYAGADLVKSQAITAEDAVKNGCSMSYKFYKQCEGLFTDARFIMMREYLKDMGLFFTVFSDDYCYLMEHQEHFKVAGGQTDKINDFSVWDYPETFISVREETELPVLDLATPMYVGGYLEKPKLELIDKYRKFYGRCVGYSDHTKGVDNCVKAVKNHRASVIEKHFTLKKNIKFKNKIFRDTVHGATPDELRNLISEVKND